MRANSTLLTARREDDHGDARPFPQALDHIETVHVGEPEIHDHHVGLARGRFDEPIRARAGFEHSVAGPTEGDAEKAPDLRLVLDEDDGGFRHRRA
jgi:hypothetical protein